MINEGGEKNGCFDNCSHEQHRHGAPRNRGDLRRDHRARVPGDARQVRHQARARFGLLGRALVLVGIGAATFLGVAAPVSASAAVGDLTPPAGGATSIPLTQLPSCSTANMFPNGVYGSNGTGLNAAAQLGWAGAPRLLVQDPNNNTKAEIVPAIPCQLVGEYNGSSSYLNQIFVQNKFPGALTQDYAYKVVVSNVCVVNGSPATVEATAPAGEESAIRASADGVSFGYRVSAAINSANCPALVSTRVVIYTRDSANSPASYTLAQTWNWSASAWTAASGGWKPATTAAGVTPPGFESPITCTINNSGADIIAVTQNVVSSAIAWIPCMLVPVGWDRALKITDAWNTGPVGQLASAYKSAVPSGIACGSVGYIPFFGQVITLNTCQGDFAPSWAKVVLTYVMVLGLCALAVRRVMWSVGSRG